MLQALRAHTAGGDALYSGGLLLLVAVVLPRVAAPGWRSIVARWLSVVGAMLVICSAAALPEWLWGMWGVAYVQWRWVWRPTKPTKGAKEPQLAEAELPVRAYRAPTRMRVVAALVLLTVTATGLATEFAEIPARPAPPAAERRGLVVIGDSISAGLGTMPEDQRWPELLAARRGGVPVANLSQPGMGVKLSGRVRSGLDAVDIDHPLVIVELGGNDMLGTGTSLADYEQHFDSLLRTLTDRFGAENVFVIELPLLPTYNAWGQTQRRMIEQHRVQRIPKRVFAGVLGASGATDDGLHLSATGHRLMADAIGDWFQP